MNSQLQEYSSLDAAENMTYTDLQKFVTRLRKINVVIGAVGAIASPGAFTPPAGLVASITDLKSLGMQPTDLLNYVFQVSGSDSWHTASEVAAYLAPLTANAVYRVVSDLYPGSAQQALGTALMTIPGVDQLISQYLA